MPKPDLWRCDNCKKSEQGSAKPDGWVLIDTMPALVLCPVCWAKIATLAGAFGDELIRNTLEPGTLSPSPANVRATQVRRLLCKAVSVVWKTPSQ